MFITFLWRGPTLRSTLRPHEIPKKVLGAAYHREYCVLDSDVINRLRFRWTCDTLTFELPPRFISSN